MGSPVAELVATALATHDKDKRASSGPIIVNDTDPSPTLDERKHHLHLPKTASDGRGQGEVEEDEPKLRWPVRHYSASADPLTRDRRIKRIETFIDKAKQRRASYREPLRKPSDGGTIRRVRTAPTPVRRGSPSAVSPLLWLTRPRSRDPSAESLFRRVGHHIKARPHPGSNSPGKTLSEESIGSSRSAPEIAITGLPSGSPANSRANPGPDCRYSRHHYHCMPALHLCNYRVSSSSKTDSSQSDIGSPSHSSQSSLKSACADAATTLTDVHVVKVAQDERGGLLTPGQATPSPSMHIVESGYGSYHVVWDDQSSPSQPLASDGDPDAVAPDKDRSKSTSPTGLERVNNKLEEWSFAARECTALDKSRSHAHFRPYVEVYQDEEDAQFDMDEDNHVLFMAPPNSKLPTPGASAWSTGRNSQQETSHSECSTFSSNGHSDSSYPSTYSPSDEHQQTDDEDSGRLAVPRLQLDDDYLFPSGCYSPRPNKPLTMADRLKPQSRSLSNLSNTSDMSDNATSLLTSHRDSVVLMAERYPDQIELPVGNPWSKRDSIAIAKERIRRKHANESGEALIKGVGILKGVGKGGVERTAPLDIPRFQQITYMGVLSPIADSSPPNSGGNNYDRKIDQLAGKA